MSQRGKTMNLVRFVCMALIILALLLIKGIGDIPAHAVDCCERTGSDYGSFQETWTCYIPGEGEYECTGWCRGIVYEYECQDPPCNNNYWITLITVTGPCESPDPTCNGLLAICAFTTQTNYEVGCWVRCQ